MMVGQGYSHLNKQSLVTKKLLKVFDGMEK
jgi:hypothetical protein